MFDAFVKNLPIRRKFASLKLVVVGLWLPATVVAVACSLGWLPAWAVLVVMAASGAVNLAVLHVAGELICRPYVDTVVRMEALAAGDVSSPILYADHRDCVGRMTVAMGRFRDNIEQMTGLETQQHIITTLRDHLKRLAGNDLDAAITETFPGAYDEIRVNFNAAARSLAQAIADVHSGAGSVLTGAKEISSAAADLAQRNERLAANLGETSGAMNEATGNVRQIAHQAEEAAKAVGETLGIANNGSAVVGEVIGAMETIRTSSDRIHAIIGLIDGIAFQTNLLALNAGVEAARAGEAGKGFAVVANEVRTLAQRSAEAAQDIKNLIKQSGSDVVSGVNLAQQAGQIISSLVERVGSMSQFVAEVSDSAGMQVRNLEQVNAAVKEMDRMTQQNAAMVEESTAAAASLASEAQALGTLVGAFRLPGGAQSPAGKSPKADRAAPAPMLRPAANETAPRPAEVRYVANGAPVAVESDWAEF
ncbi:methyl-accepting chemotaxis protein [Novosphingobium flavum]|uniref:Methyl-accepting chemotaxis protein n=1 Tax=Novosphingobium flavum TaxID=1778672 RepID=A0A7X1KKN1_9SPHN|nr:methyl-accepting chemotaxis protein [Novosphingobium flavum]MBC2664692.1 methyl-accepting chemotaxis protein [Novosphingobium flavum]